MKLITHPDNVEWLKQAFVKEQKASLFDDFQSVVNPYIDKEKWSGKYFLPDGRIVEKQDIVIPSGRFFEYDFRD